MKIHRAGIVGLTGIAAGAPPPIPDPVFGHAHGDNHASGYAHIPNVTVVGACDLVPERNAEFVQNWGHRWPEARTYTDFRLMLAEAHLDILSVVTPDHRHADIVVAAVGVAHFVQPEWIKPGAAVLDVGITRVEGAGPDGRAALVGDVDPRVAEVAGFFSPNPGGVGPMTRAMLVKNVVDAASR
jgi:hypothetical protein